MHFSNVLLLYWQDGLEEQLSERLHLGIGQALSRRPLDLDYLQFVCNNALILFQSFADQVEIDNYIVQQLNYILEKIQAVFGKNVTAAHVDMAEGKTQTPYSERAAASFVGVSIHSSIYLSIVGGIHLHGVP